MRFIATVIGRKGGSDYYLGIDTDVDDEPVIATARLDEKTEGFIFERLIIPSNVAEQFEVLCVLADSRKIHGRTPALEFTEIAHSPVHFEHRVLHSVVLKVRRTDGKNVQTSRIGTVHA